MDKEYENLDLTNDFIFSKVMRNKKLCKQLLEVVLQIKIKDIIYPEEQKTIDLSYDSKSVRLDVFVEDGIDTVYNVEMQTTDTKNLPKRSRYYQGMIDLHLIEKGENYNKLKKSYVIFLCTQDIFKKNRCIYTFENICTEDLSLKLGDGTIKVFLYAHGTNGEIPLELRNFLNYLAYQKVSDQFTNDLKEEVEKAISNEEWRHEYMTLKMIEQQKFDQGVEQGVELGKLLIIESLIEQKKMSIKDATELLHITADELVKKLQSLK